jgi:hypothetical protein
MLAIAREHWLSCCPLQASPSMIETLVSWVFSTHTW